MCLTRGHLHLDFHEVKCRTHFLRANFFFIYISTTPRFHFCNEQGAWPLVQKWLLVSTFLLKWPIVLFKSHGRTRSIQHICFVTFLARLLRENNHHMTITLVWHFFSSKKLSVWHPFVVLLFQTAIHTTCYSGPITTMLKTVLFLMSPRVCW